MGEENQVVETQLVNQEFTESIAKELYEHYSAAVGGIAYNGDPLPGWDAFIAHPEKQKQAEGWRKTAEYAIARLMPVAVNSELPNDAKLVGTKPLSESAKEDVGGMIDPSTPEHTKSGDDSGAQE